jgi:hypothetical protein
MSDGTRIEETALPDIYRVKNHYLDSYYLFIENSISYELNKNPNAFKRCKGAIKSLFMQLKWELTEEERKTIQKKDIDKFQDLKEAFDILSKKLKKLRVTDIKLKEPMTFDFK